MDIKQIIYYGLDEGPESIDNGDFNEILIKTYPGVIVTINNEDIRIGDTGVYTISHEEGVVITSISVPENTKDIIKSIPSAYLVIVLAKIEETESTPTPSEEETSGQGTSSDEEESSETSDEEEIVKNNHDSRSS